MSKAVLIIINGLSGTGKSGLARRLATDLQLPCIGNDQLKEVLFDTLGWDDLELSEMLGIASSAILWSVTGSIVGAGQSLVIESAFHRDRDAPQLREIAQNLRPLVIEIHCFAARSVLIERVKARTEKGDRHPGHGDQDREALEDQVIPELKAADDHLLDAADLYIPFDAADESDEAYENLRTQVKQFMEGTG